MTFVAHGSPGEEIPRAQLSSFVEKTLGAVANAGKIIAIPPDITRFHSKAGEITDLVYEFLGPRLAAVLPALGSHTPMTDREIATMYPRTPPSLFRTHDWRRDILEFARIESDFVRQVSANAVDYDYPVQANRMLSEGGFDAVISIGQVVPHEVVGMANQAKNIFVGTGGKEAIDKSHFLGAVYGMEKMMGRTDTPVRRILDKALELSRDRLPPILWILTVIGRTEDGRLVMRGFFSGDDAECFEKAAALSRQVNIEQLDGAIDKAVVWLDPSEYRSTWLGNKAVYRTRMAMADKGELIILAPGLAHFGEDAAIDALIRKYGYRSSAEIRELVRHNSDLAESLSAAAHLIHGSSEGRFTVTYAPGGAVSRKEVESVGYRWAPLEKMLGIYDVGRLAPGWNNLPDGEKIFFVPNPALGLWTSRARFNA